MANDESLVIDTNGTLSEIAEVQPDMFGSVSQALTLQDVQRGIRGVSRPRDLRPLIQKSTHDPLMNMLELAMQAKAEGNDSLAFNRFAECLPYVWTRVSMATMQLGAEAGAPGTAGEVVYRWANTGEA
jgi:hypothetical protein